MVVWTLGLLLVLGTLTSLAVARDRVNLRSDSGNEFHTVCRAGPPTCDAATIQAAVDQAASGDEIRIAAGTYSHLTFRSGITQVVYLTKSLTLRGGFTTTNWLDPDPIANPTRLDASGEGRVIFVDGEILVRLEGLELTGGDATAMGGAPLGGGGGLAAVGATVELKKSRVFSNTAGSGGGVYVLEGHPTISQSMILSNSAETGGGLHLDHCSESILAENLVTGNVATATERAALGGGLYLVGGDTTFVSNVVRANKAGTEGGGLHALGSNLNMLESEVRENSAGVYGGGLFAQGGVIRCRLSTFAENTAGSRGGGISLRWSEATLGENLIEGNTAAGGGGIEAYLSDVTLTQNLIIGNQATIDCGGGGHIAYSDAWVGDNVVSGNRAEQNGGGLAFCHENALLDGNTLIGNTASTGAGGGLFFSESLSTLNATIVRGNNALYGGGLGLREASAITIANTLVVDNEASADGGGLYVESSSVEALHTTLAHNRGPSGLCVVRHAGIGSDATLVNTILVSHTLGVTISEGSHGSMEATLWGAGSWANGLDSAGGGTLVTGTLNLWQEPGFVDGDYYLGLGSAAIDAGIDAGVNLDVQGQPRPHYDGFDLGADEWWPVTVSKRATPTIVDRGQVVTYTIRLTNTTGLTAPVTLTDPLPQNISFLGPLNVSHGQGSYTAGTITWTGTLAPTGTGWLQWRVSIEPNAPYSTTITNLAQVSDPYGSYVAAAPVFLPPRRTYLPLAFR